MMSVSVIMLALSLACTKEVKKTDDRPLYVRLGEKTAIEAVVKELIENIKADDRINKKFANADLKDLQNKLVDQICQASGGPCQYTGKNMKEAHQGMGITEAEFNALVEDLVKALDKLGVKEKEKNDLIALLAPMKTDIVEGGPGQ
jgi:hemoglobin